MTTQSTNTLAPAYSTSSPLGAWKAFTGFVASIAQTIRNARELERLMGKSNAQLAAMGLTRDQIVSFVFRDQR